MKVPFEWLVYPRSDAFFCLEDFASVPSRQSFRRPLPRSVRCTLPSFRVQLCCAALTDPQGVRFLLGFPLPKMNAPVAEISERLSVTSHCAPHTARFVLGNAPQRFKRWHSEEPGRIIRA